MNFKFRKILSKIKTLRYYVIGKKFLSDPYYLEVQKTIEIEESKRPLRHEIINFLLTLHDRETAYLEIGVRNPEDNFNHVNSNIKYSVDPGIEFEANPSDFKLTSDAFFQKLSRKEILSHDIRFDVIFVDGLHLADQTDRDITNALKYIKDDGFVVVHDCNPPTEWHARESYGYENTPAHKFWNGTTWKAFYKWRINPELNSCCIDTDWGIGIISKKYKFGTNAEQTNSFFEYKIFDANRKSYLNLIDFQTFKNFFSVNKE